MSKGWSRKPWNESSRRKRAIRWFRRLLQYAVVIYLLYRIWRLGWVEVLQSLPSQPLFYIIGFFFFIALPVSEIFNYKRLFRVPAARGFWTFLRKRAYNNEVLGYSGEVFLYFWAWKEIGNEERRVFHGVKANNIISGFCSTLWALIVVAVVFSTGSLPLLKENVQSLGSYITGGIAIMFVVTAVLIFFRRHLLGLDGRTALLLGSVHLGRLTLVAALRIAQWASVMPEASFKSWVALLTFEVVITRLPFLPGRDLLFAGASVDLAPALGVAAAPMLAMVVAHGALERIMNFLVVILPVGKGAPDSLRGTGSEAAKTERV